MKLKSVTRTLLRIARGGYMLIGVAISGIFMIVAIEEIHDELLRKIKKHREAERKKIAKAVLDGMKAMYGVPPSYCTTERTAEKNYITLSGQPDTEGESDSPKNGDNSVEP